MQDVLDLMDISSTDPRCCTDAQVAPTGVFAIWCGRLTVAAAALMPASPPSRTGALPSSCTADRTRDSHSPLSSRDTCPNH